MREKESAKDLRLRGKLFWEKGFLFYKIPKLSVLCLFYLGGKANRFAV